MNRVTQQQRIQEEHDHALYVAQRRAQLLKEESQHEKAGTLTDEMYRDYAERIGFLDDSLLP